MALRTDAAAVQESLGSNYDSRRKPPLNAALRFGNVLTTRLVTLAAQDDMTLTTDELREIETNLAAHYYCLNDKLLTSKSTKGASGSFQGQYGMQLESSDYGQAALTLDWTGILREMGKTATVQAFWGGLPESEQQTYEERN